MTRAVVVDDHPVFRKGLAALLRASEVDVVGEAGSGLEALAVVAETQPDVVLMDVSMPDLDGIAATEQLTARHPDVRVVVITQLEDESTVSRMLRAGASAYVTKQSSPEQILAAVAAAAGGALWLGPGVPRPLGGGGAPSAPTIPPPLSGLTARESSIADLVGRGLTNPVISERLGLSTKTVANYVSIIMLKVGAADRQELARTIRSLRG
ncbi:response regulator transcription factor [Agromyces seonyuensis]|uniref:Response regulator n=1 Tax=Agromyces seonyuensis TaxID=2662446 RepID=A0A6I4P0D1_9MICO|nr:response regulator transcription factor [Agromyces seonyuensis]MWC00021.1 response regulator [Agromyces seonyuensis]